MKQEQVSPLRATLPRLLLAAFIVVMTSGCSLMGIRNTAEPSYSVVQNDDKFEVRDYEAMVIAETLVDANFDDAGDIAFRRLFGYISGDNKASSEISMTAPVMALDEKRASGEEISMTAPVTGEKTALGWRFAFVLPSEFTLATAPEPTDPDVKLNQIPARKAAVVRYSGSWNEAAYEKNLLSLQSWMQRSGLEADSTPRVAAYDPPWTLPFLRRNEIIIDLKS